MIPTILVEVPEIKPRSYARCCNIIFYFFLGIIEIAVIPLFYTVRYPKYSWGVYLSKSDENFTYYLNFEYKILADLSIMMLVGYGYIISYLRFHRWMCLVLSFYIVMISLQYYILFYGFWKGCWNGTWIEGIPMSISIISLAQKAAITILISLGALIGKVDFFQMTIFSLGELIIYTLLESILFRTVGILDQGGAIYIHTFGAFYGIFASWIYSPKANSKDNPNNRVSYSSATVAFIGTFFLWITFPTFNSFNYHHSYLNPGTYYSNIFPSESIMLVQMINNPINFNLAFLGISNTYWSLIVSTTTTFWLSMILDHGKLIIHHILNSTLAGGIMIASCCDMFAFPFPSLIIGAFAGLFSVFSYTILWKLLENFLLFDTRGILHLHGLPGIFGGIASAIAISTINQNYYGNPSISIDYIPWKRKGWDQGGFQIVGLLISLAMAILAGSIMGIILRIWRVLNLPEDTFGDQIFFKMIQTNEVMKPHLIQNQSSVMSPPLVVQKIY